MIRIRFQLDSALARLQALADRLADAESLLAPAVPIVAAAIERNFDEEGRPLPWPPLAPRYARAKARRLPGTRILERTGRLRRSVRTGVESNALVASTDVPYAAAHQFGAPRRHLPARPFLALTESDIRAAGEAVADTLSLTGRGSRVAGHEQ
jgi:phage gpG-like protein